MTQNSLFLSLVSVLRAVLCWTSAFWLFTSTGGGQLQSIQLVPFLIAATLCALVCHAFLSRPRSFPAVIGLGVALTIAMNAILLLRFSAFHTIRPILFGIVSVTTVTVLSITTCLKPPTPVNCISSMELTVLFFFVFLWYQAVSGLEAVYCVPLLCAAALSLLAILYQRLSSVDDSDRKKARGLFLGVAALFLVALLLVFFTACGADSMGKWMMLLVSAVLYVLRLLASLFDLFLMWLSTLFGTIKTEGAALPSPAVSPTLDTIGDLSLSPTLLLMAGSIALCLLLGALVCLLIRFRKLRISGAVRAASHSRVVRQRITPGQWWERIRNSLVRRLRLMFRIIASRGTPQELYLYLVRASGAAGLGLQPGETPCAFLQRLADAAANEPALFHGLCTLSQALQEQLYAPSPAVSFSVEEARSLRRGFRRFRQRALLRRLREWCVRRFSKATSADAAL